MSSVSASAPHPSTPLLHSFNNPKILDVSRGGERRDFLDSNALLVYPKGIQARMEPGAATTSKEYKTHRSRHWERAHALSAYLLIPARLFANALAHLIEPTPGSHKDQFFLRLGIRVSCFIGLFVLLPLALLSVLLGGILRLSAHHDRPLMQYIADPKNPNHKNPERLLNKDQPLHVRTHNVGFVPSHMGVVGDLRDPATRAQELVTSIVEDSKAPDVICFQEVFNEDAAEVLVNGLKEKYPYILHSVFPHGSGFSSGAVIASKYPLSSIQVRRLDHMLGPERLSPRGLVRVTIQTGRGPLHLYSTHLQALIGHDRSEARRRQIEQIKDWMDDDARLREPVAQVLVGDFNSSRVSAWGDDNYTGQAEQKTTDCLEEHFADVFAQTHDKRTGRRTEGESRFVTHDNERMGVHRLPEPTGSWYKGPFEDSVLVQAQMKQDRRKHNYPDPKPVEGVNRRPSGWGTDQWALQQDATARFDYVLIPKTKQGRCRLTGTAEIRRVVVPKGAQSAPTDHLPVDACLWTP